MTIWSTDGVHLIGKVGAAPQMTTLTGSETATFPIELKTTRCRTDDHGHRHPSEGTVWFRVVVFKPRLVFESKRLRVGEVVSICGTIERRSYNAGDSEQKLIEIIAEELLRPQSPSAL